MQKKAPGIKRLLVSRGRVVVSPGRGLIWKVDFPYEALSVFGPGKIGRTDEAGNYSVREAPQAAQASRRMWRRQWRFLPQNKAAISPGRCSVWTAAWQCKKELFLWKNAESSSPVLAP